MTTGDIFLKLLPFTHSRDGAVDFVLKDGFGGLNELDIGDAIITGIICSIVSLFILFVVKLWLSKRKDKAKIDYLLKVVREFKDEPINERYNELRDRLKAFHGNGEKNELFKLWDEFHESLIITKGTSGRDEIHNSIDAEHFFNKHTLITHLGSKLYSAIPSLLLGLGLIGTFLGLFVGLVVLNIEDSSTLKESMKDLIHAAGVKFASSIWGLSCSILFTLLDKWWEKGLEDKLAEIQRIINEIFPRRTVEQILGNMQDFERRQTDALEMLGNTLVDPLIEAQNRSNAQSTERLDKMIELLGGFTTKQGEATTEALSTAVKSFVEGMEKAGLEQGKQFQDALATTTAKFEGLIQTIERISTTQEERADRLTADIEQIKTEQHKVLEKMNEKFVDGFEKMGDSVAGTVQGITENQLNLLNKLTPIIDALGNAPKELSLSFERMRKETGTVEKSIREITQTLQNVPSHIQRFGEHSEKLARFAAHIEKVSAKFAEFTAQFDTYRESVQSSSTALHETALQAEKTSSDSKTTYETLAAQHKDLLATNKQSVDEFGKSVKSYLDEYHQNTHAAVQRTFVEFDTHLSGFAELMASALRELQSAIEDIESKLNKR